MQPRALSQLLNEISAHFSASERISVGTVLDAFHERGFGFFLFLIALPAALPLPALGINTIIALPLILLTGQQMLGFRAIWLPEKIRQKQVSTRALENFIIKARPWITKLEHLVRPRLGFMTSGIMSNLIGLSGFIMALSVTLPLPLTNTVPSMGICLMAVGVVMRDGLAVIGGILVGLIWVAMLALAFVLFGIEGLDIVKEWIKSFL